jgi:hypothetical protein
VAYADQHPDFAFGLSLIKGMGSICDVVNKIYVFHGMEPFYKPEPPNPKPIKDHEWWKDYDEDGNFLPNLPKK